jgi:hypothetical protein
MAVEESGHLSSSLVLDDQRTVQITGAGEEKKAKG